ncbi:unnamed protein product [Peniophora sp. CBMAI 1063]|nr:unnamed protein product [Peniophora sp. CBMAI 1063]
MLAVWPPPSSALSQPSYSSLNTPIFPSLNSPPLPPPVFPSLNTPAPPPQPPSFSTNHSRASSGNNSLSFSASAYPPYAHPNSVLTPAPSPFRRPSPAARYSLHDPANAHSRSTSTHEQFVYHQHPPHHQHHAPPQLPTAGLGLPLPPLNTQPERIIAPTPLTASLNPHAKPFVFGSRAPAGPQTAHPLGVGHAGAQGSFGPGVNHAASGSLGSEKPLNAHSQHPSVSFVPTPAVSSAFNPSKAPATAHPLGSGASLANGLSGSSSPEKGHSRAASVGKPLNVAAPEFKPVGTIRAGGFNVAAPEFKPAFNVAAPEFKPSFALPRLDPIPVAPRPFSNSNSNTNSDKENVAGLGPKPVLGGLDTTVDKPLSESTPFTFRAPAGPSVPQFTFPQDNMSSIRSTQGREKRQRRMSDVGLESEEDMADEEAEADEDEDDYGVRTPDEERAKSFRFPPNANVEKELGASTSTFGGVASPEPEEDLGTGAAVSARNMGINGAHELPVPPSMSRARRAPIPLDFKHPVSTNTVPAGLFKALGASSGPSTEDERTRRAVRSRLGSRDLDANSRAALSRSDSLDDVHVPAISRKISRGRLVTDPVVQPTLPTLPGGRNHHRRSSLPAVSTSSLSEAAGLGDANMSVAHRLELLNHVEDRLEALLDAKLGALQLDEVLTLFKAQLEDAAAIGLREHEDSQRDARGELDLEIIRDTLEQNLADARAAMRMDLEEALAAHRSAVQAPTLPSLSSLTVQSPSSEPVDYDALTTRLAQAVKPHISQLIDLASDKRETAALIVEALRPALSSLTPVPPRVPTPKPPAPAFDSAALLQDIKTIVAPLDAHELKEHVADLVVARLDARLSTRDRTIDNLPARVAEPVKEAVNMLSELARSQDALATHTRSIPDEVRAALAAALPKDQPITMATLSRIEEALKLLSAGQKTLAEQSNGTMAVLGRLGAIPDAVTAVEALRTSFASAATKDDLEALRSALSTSNETQLQLAKARAQYGNARAEKDILAELRRESDAERDRLRSQVEELNAALVSRSTEAAAAQARSAELNEALSQSLARLKASDVANSTQAERIAELEKSNRALAADKEAMGLKVHAAEMQAAIASRDKEAAQTALAEAQRERAAQPEPSNHYAELRTMMEALQSQLSQRDEGELADARAARDRAKALEGEYAALQRRFRDQETRATSADRAAAQARTSLQQAQARAAEWEKRARDVEHEAQTAQARAEDAESRAKALEADREVDKMQSEEKDAQERLAQNRESKLRDQVASLESDVARLRGEITRLQAETAQERAKAKAAASQPPPRPDSRASTAYGGSRAATPVGVKSVAAPSARSNTPPTSSIWDSIHAPKGIDARSRYMAAAALGNGIPKKAPRPGGYYSRPAAPSPTPSVVSVAPTQGADGWWE